MNRKILIEYLLPPIYRKYAWVALLYALTAPFDSFFQSQAAIYTKARRRAGCDGSVIALTFLIKQEFGIDISFEDGEGGSRQYLRQRAENIGGVYFGAWFIFGREESPVGGVDYTVHAPGTTAETRARIKSVLMLYNSAGFTFEVIE